MFAKKIPKKAIIIGLCAVLGVALIILGSLSVKGKADGSSEISELESKFERAILGMEGISEVRVIITEQNGSIAGAAAVCKGGSGNDERRITELLKSGLDLPANRIYVVCN